MNRILIHLLFIAAVFVTTLPSSMANVIFLDNFDDGDVSDWTVSSLYPGTPMAMVRTDSFVSPSYALYTNFVTPTSSTDYDFQANHVFTAPTAGNYILTLWARSSTCAACIVSYEIRVDGVSLTRTFANDFEFRSFALNSLTAGAHTLSLGGYTTNSSRGIRSASFDDVMIESAAEANTTPEPASFGLLLAGLGLLGIARRKQQS
jgi:PEP-CTERM motif